MSIEKPTKTDGETDGKKKEGVTERGQDKEYKIEEKVNDIIKGLGQILFKDGHFLYRPDGTLLGWSEEMKRRIVNGVMKEGLAGRDWVFLISKDRYDMGAISVNISIENTHQEDYGDHDGMTMFEIPEDERSSEFYTNGKCTVGSEDTTESIAEKIENMLLPLES